MVISRYAPDPALTNYIKCYYYIEKNDHEVVQDTFFADGCIEAVFSVDWEFYKGGQREDWAKIIGQIIMPRELKIIGKGQSFGIWFYPHTFPRFANVAMCELNDRVETWDVLFPKSFADFVGNCLSEKKLDRLKTGADRFFLERLVANTQSMDMVAEAAVQYLYQQKNNSDLNHLASWLNVSQRYLQRAFLAKVGFSQKLFLKILRFQQTLRAMRQGKTSTLTALACECDYYDQSHFIREFKSFTGIAPSQFETDKLPISQHFIQVE